MPDGLLAPGQTPSIRILNLGAVPPIELLPFLKYIPKMFAKWKAEAESVRDMQQEIYSRLLDEVREHRTSGTQTGCFTEQILARKESAELSDSQLSYLGGALIEGSAGTTTAWNKFFVMAMSTHLDVQKKSTCLFFACDELDQVIGNARMPKLGDLASLPYLQAVIKEVHRWRPIGPFAIPHATLGDIYYQRYRIPPETTLFMNVWGISHDPDRYDRLEEFWPDRWIQHKYGLKHDSTHSNSNPPWFGVGKRACPGANLAQNSLAISTMSLLWGFSFQPEVDRYTGKPIKIDVFSFSEGLEMSPEQFRCQISPRSTYHADIIEHEFIAAAAELKQYECETQVE
ncbi:cytochrome P450 family protein [Ceratobasidium sp. AG-Ba]|nr:cytochrome P450 family protein [Ceratobasidium sp. AG-Ba]QRW04436.1 cytochrome P450 family protein [Ceratobasidium sp. AG-Ba]